MVETATKAVEDEIQLVIFTIGNEEFAAEINQVREIISASNITRVPAAPRFVSGVINLRGKLITVVDLHKRLGYERLDSVDEPKIIVSDVKNGVLGMMVDSVSEVARIPESRIEPPPPMSAGRIDSEYIRGIAKSEKRLIVILDLDKVLIDAEEGKIELEEGEV